MLIRVILFFKRIYQCRIRITDMTSATKPGNFWKITFLVAKVPGEALPEIIGNLSTQFSGFCEQAHRGEICRQTMETGRTPTEDFVAGETEEYGKNSLKSLLTNQTLNG